MQYWINNNTHKQYFCCHSKGSYNDIFIATSAQMKVKFVVEQSSFTPNFTLNGATFCPYRENRKFTFQTLSNLNTASVDNDIRQLSASSKVKTRMLPSTADRRQTDRVTTPTPTHAKIPRYRWSIDDGACDWLLYLAPRRTPRSAARFVAPAINQHSHETLQ